MFKVQRPKSKAVGARPHEVGMSLRRQGTAQGRHAVPLQTCGSEKNNGQPQGDCPCNDDNAVDGFCRGEKFFAPTSPASWPAIICVCQCPSVVLSSLGRGPGMGLLNMYTKSTTTVSRLRSLLGAEREISL